MIVKQRKFETILFLVCMLSAWHITVFADIAGPGFNPALISGTGIVGEEEMQDAGTGESPSLVAQTGDGTQESQEGNEVSGSRSPEDEGKAPESQGIVTGQESENAGEDDEVVVKPAEDVRRDLAAVPAGPGLVEWGMYFPVANQPPIGDKPEDWLRSYGAYSRVNTDEKVIFLTFDLGYENGNAPSILDTLKKHGVKAAFFLTGNYFTQHPELVLRMVSEGHIVGNHTLSHPDMGNISTHESFFGQLDAVEERYRQVSGKQMKRFYRPPSGKYSESHFLMARAMGYKTILWSIAYKDWEDNAQPSHEKALATLRSRIHPGAIMLLHGTSRTNREILDLLLTELEAQGYTFKTLDELPENEFSEAASRLSSSE